MARREQPLTQGNDINVKYSAGVKLSATMDAATIVLLQGTGVDIKVAGCETLACSNSLLEVWEWLDKQTARTQVTVVVGVDSSRLRFLGIRIPVVEQIQRYPLIQTQAEGMLPLSADQVSLAWRTEQDSQGLLCRTVAVRKELLQSVLNQSEQIQAVTPEAVGLAKAWERFGRISEQQCILLYRRKNDFLVAMLRDEHLQRSAVVDAEGADLWNGVPSGLLFQDILTEIEGMGAECEQKLPLYILSENTQDDFLDALNTQIQELGWKTEVVFLEDFPRQDCGLEVLEAFGLALTAITDQCVDYDFQQAETLGQPEETNANAGMQLRKAIMITIALLVFALGISYWSIKKDVKLLHRVMAASHEDLTVQQVLAEQAYRETVARARPDMVDLFQRIQKCQGSILLDTVEFEKGKPAKITATADSYDAAYQFQKELEARNKNVITKTKLLEPRLDQKGNKVKFTITFHYRNFSK